VIDMAVKTGKPKMGKPIANEKKHKKTQANTQANKQISQQTNKQTNRIFRSSHMNTPKADVVCEGSYLSVRDGHPKS